MRACVLSIMLVVVQAMRTRDSCYHGVLSRRRTYLISFSDCPSLITDSSNRAERPSCLLAIGHLRMGVDFSLAVDNHSSQPNNRLYYFLLTTSTDFILVCDHTNVASSVKTSFRSSLSHEESLVISCRPMTSSLVMIL